QHEAHANEVRIMKERFPNPLALVANIYNSSPSYSSQTLYHQKLSPFASQQQVLPLASQQLYDVPMVQQRSYQAPVANHSLVVYHQSYQAPDVHQPPQSSFPTMDSGLVVPSFLPSDDPIASLNKAMAFISTTFTSRYPPTNNQLRTSSNLRNQATIQDGRVTVQTVQGRQNQGYASSGARSNTTVTLVIRTGRTNTAGQANVIRCYNCQEEGHMARQCNKPKRPRNSTWFKEKAMLAEDLELGVVLDEEHMAFLADNGGYSYYYPDINITSDSNMISYEKYLKETENTIVQDTSSSAQQDAMIISVIEEMTNQVA
ncbi:retrovirus-related pol polyprotein from transposon TNT 1-94, partial [Tanacetum coccineum]